MMLPPPVSLTASKNNREPIPRLPDDTLSLLVFPREGHMHFQRTKRTKHSSVDAARSQTEHFQSSRKIYSYLGQLSRMRNRETSTPSQVNNTHFYSSDPTKKLRTMFGQSGPWVHHYEWRYSARGHGQSRTEPAQYPRCIERD